MQAEHQVKRWQNNRILLGFMFLTAGVLTLGGAFMILAAIVTLFPFKTENLSTAVSIGIAAGAIFLTGFKLWRMTLKAARHLAVFQNDGVHFFYGAQETDVVAWPDIREVTRGGGQITIHAGADRYLSFDGYSFFLPSRLGKAVAARAGKELRPASAQ